MSKKKNKKKEMKTKMKMKKGKDEEILEENECMSVYVCVNVCARGLVCMTSV